MKQNRKILTFCLVSLLLISCDRVTKNLARSHLQSREPISYFHDSLRLEYAENTGAFLSFGENWPPFVSLFLFTILPLFFLSVLFAYAIFKSAESSYLKMMALGLVFSGGIGNLTDRVIFQKHVSDFINIGINRLRTGIFNLADVCITAGVILFLLLQLREKK